MQLKPEGAPRVSKGLAKSHTFMQEFLSPMKKLLKTLPRRFEIWNILLLCMVKLFFTSFVKNHGVEYIIKLKECETFFKKNLPKFLEKWYMGKSLMQDLIYLYFNNKL
jgi:hypothetical protein